LRLAESVGDGATDAVVVALDMSTLQTRCRKKVESVGINEEIITTRARFNGLANVRPQCRNRYAEMQRSCCAPLCVRKVQFFKVPFRGTSSKINISRRRHTTHTGIDSTSC
jgi:hypothetical protein